MLRIISNSQLKKEEKQIGKVSELVASEIFFEKLVQKVSFVLSDFNKFKTISVFKGEEDILR